MKNKKIRKGERGDLVSLKNDKILDASEEQIFDGITRLAASICGTPIALISVLDKDRKWFQSQQGIPEGEISSDNSFFEHVANAQKVFIVEDCSLDRRFSGNPLVLNDPNICFYAGAPLITSDGFIIGVFCVIDRIPRKLDENQIMALELLSKLIVSQFEPKFKSFWKNLSEGNFKPGGLVKIINVAQDAGEKELISADANQKELTISNLDLVIEFDLHGKILDVDESFLNLMKYTKSELQDTHHSIFLANEDYFSKTYRLFWQNLKNGQFQQGDFKWVDKFGKNVWLRGTYNPIFDIEGNPYKILKFAVDITEKKLAEEKLKDAKKDLYDFVKNANVGQSWIDGNGIIIWANKAELELLGYTIEEYIGQSISKFHYDQNTINDILIRLSKRESIIDYEATLIAKDGSKKIVLISSVPYVLDGIFVYSQCFIRDITDQKLGVLRPVDLKKKIDIVSSNFDNQKKALDCFAIVAETDKFGRITYVNDKFLEITKYKYEELIGQDHRILNSGHHSKEFFKNLWDTIKMGKIWQGEFKNKAKDGTLYWVDTIIYPVLNEKNEITSFVSIRFDITEKKEALINLEAAKKMAIEADTAKSVFLYTMSHEIRTPLNGIISMSDFLKETNLNKDQLELAETISQSGKILLTIINDILDFSKIESGKMELEEVEFDIKNYLQDLLKPFAYSVRSKNIDLNFESNECLNMVLGDKGKLGQIISNLVSNAIKFTQKGSVNVRAEFKNINDKTQVIIWIQDTGVGIPIEAQGKLFQAFTQAEKSTSRNFGGTGLGLKISKSLAELMNGGIIFESLKDRGSTFKVEVFFKTGQVIDRNKIKIEKLEQVQNQRPILGRILVAEDNVINQKVISRMLDKWQCSYHIVANGHEAIESVLNENYDLILMDCQMPGMDGYEVTKYIRNNPTLNDNIIIIALTANVVSGDQEKCYKAGMNEYLTKPINKEKLEILLRKYLELLPRKLPEKLLDLNILKQLDEFQEDGKSDFIVEIIDSFLLTSPPRIELISKYFDELNIRGLMSEAHALKSSLLTVGSLMVADICQELEDVGEKEDFVPIFNLISSLKTNYLLLCNELRKFKSTRNQNLNNKAS